MLMRVLDMRAIFYYRKSMLRRIGYFLIPSLFVLLAMTAYGQDTSSEPNLDTSGTPSKQNSRTIRVNAQEKKQAAQERLTALKEKRASFSASLREKKEEALTLRKQKQQELQEKLQTFKDEQKKARIEKIDEKLAQINTRRTDRWVEALEKLAGIVDRLDAKVATAETEGKDVATAKSTIEDARDAIATAQSTVSSQAGKDYTVSLTDESTAKNLVGKTVSGMQADLRAVHKAIIDARKAVMTAAKEVKKLNAPKTEEGATESVTTQ